MNHSNYCVCFFSYDEAKKTMDPGFPKQVDATFSGLTSKVTAAAQHRGELHSRLTPEDHDTIFTVPASPFSFYNI